MFPVAPFCGAMTTVYVPVDGSVTESIYPVLPENPTGATRLVACPLHHWVAPCSCHSSTTRMSLTQSRTPSSVVVQNEYCSEYCACTWPTQRTL